jgi:hypothetical protein
MIDFFRALEDYDKYFEGQLALSGTILGLIVATSTFILQSGFTSFQYSRTMFVKYYVHQSKFIFLSLAYNIFFSLIILYINLTSIYLFIAHVFFALVFSKYFLDFYSHKGYILTLHSNKLFNPYKSGLRRYFRYINNLGPIPNIIIYATIYIIFFYPLHFNQPLRLNNHQVYMTTVSCLAFCIVVIIRIIPQFFEFSEQEYKSKTKNEVIDNIEIDLTKENEILKDLLIKNGRAELQEHIKTDIFENLFVHMSNSKKEAFFVINIQFSNKDIYEIIESIEKYSFDFFIELSNIHVDINSFVLSYFIKIDKEDKSRNYFIRAKRNEIDELKKKSTEPKEFIENIKNKVVDELFRNL